MNSESEDDELSFIYLNAEEEESLNNEDPGDAPPQEPVEMEAEEDASADEEQFDITLAATHSYMGTELQEVSGRNVLEAGWRGVVPATLYRGCVFPGETVPLLLLDNEDANTLTETLKRDRLFALLCPDGQGAALSGLGVVCEVFQAAAAPARYKARALHRCRLAAPAPQPHLIHTVYHKMRQLEVIVLPELTLSDPLRHARLACLDPRRRGDTRRDRWARALDAALTPWPLFVFDIFHYGRMRDIIKEYFKTLGLERLVPSEAVSLSFWAARNLTLSARDRLALFTVDNTLHRLHMECKFISRKSVVCCGACRAVLARREHVFAMSSDGVHSTYTNPGGHMHDIVTVSAARNTALSGASSAEYSWFPGYRWTTVMCARCMAHVGWRFDALRRNLRPAQFYGLCRNYAPPDERDHDRDSDSDSDTDAAADADADADVQITPLQFRLVDRL